MWKSLLVVLVVAGMMPAATSLATDNGAPNLRAALQAKDPRVSIQFLYEDCTAADPQRQMFCAGFISAMWDHMWLLGGDDSTRALLGICTDTPVSYGAAKQTFNNWAKKHPEKWNLDRMYGVIWALQEAYPCK
jgi:hypothetical protein